MKPTNLLLVLLLFSPVSCSGKRARLLFREVSPDQTKKVEIWWHPESDFELQSDAVWVVLTDVSDSANFLARDLHPKAVNSVQYHNMKKENPAVSIVWGSEPFEAKVVDAESRLVLLEYPKKETERQAPPSGGDRPSN